MRQDSDAPKAWKRGLGLAGVGLLVWSATGLSEQIVSKISWSQLEREGKLKDARVLPADARTRFETIQIENMRAEPRGVTLLVLDKPGVTSSRYAVRGQVRYERMEETGYLEMWNFLTGGGRYFSRTLAGSGPLASLTGTSGWRPFLLPFDTNGKGRPERLIVNVVFGGRGTVYLSPLELVQYSGSEDPLTPAGAWWNDRQGGLIGGLAGGTLGLLGALVGGLAGSGRARRLVLGILKTMIAASAVALLLGGVALAAGQPYAVYYPLLLLGVIGVAVPAGLFATLRRRYEQIELRRMSAFDAPGA
jgi:hypothetical protein